MKVVLCMVCLFVAVAFCAPQYKPILLKDVKSLRFIAGQYALNTRNTQAIPQLECAYTPVEDPSLLPQDVICHNAGFDSTGAIVWKCDAIMSDTLEFDNLQVTCEGYNRPGDEYVKEGSCSLRYTLKMASVDRMQNNNNNNEGFRHHHQPRPEHPREHYRTEQPQHVEVAEGWSFTSVLIFVLIVVLIVRCIRKHSKKSTSSTSNSNTDANSNTTCNDQDNSCEPSAPPYSEDDSSSFSKRSGYAETISR